MGILLKYLDKENYYFTTVDWEIEHILDFVGFPEEFKQDITGAVVEMYDGDYVRVWLTESCAPYSIFSMYHELPYYKPENMDNTYLPCYWQEETYEEEQVDLRGYGES